GLITMKKLLVIGLALVASIGYGATLQELENQCRQKEEAEACYKAALSYVDGGNISETDRKDGIVEAPQDFAKARFFMEEAYELGSSDATVIFGTMLMEGIGGPVDIPNGELLLGEACENGDSYTCSQLGKKYTKGEGSLKKSLKNAAKYYELGCKLGDGDSCLNAGRQYYDGSGVLQSYVKAKEYFAKACEADIESGCSQYAELNKKGY
ncbi:MAG: sel1 repeat family protein, partial [Burkholderiales bacterium]|nr:sel1 repeat family protein [Burkholderiales bacterium]